MRISEPIVESFHLMTASICSSKIRHFCPSISASGRVRLARSEADVGATVITEPMKLVAVTTARWHST
jgi:hypothetical protein